MSRVSGKIDPQILDANDKTKKILPKNVQPMATCRMGLSGGKSNRELQWKKVENQKIKVAMSEKFDPSHFPCNEQIRGY